MIGAEAWRPHARGSAHPARERSCRSSTGVPTALCVEGRTLLSGTERESAEGDLWMVQIDYQFASEKTNMEISAEQVVTIGPMDTIFMATFCGRSAVAAMQ